MRLFRYGIFLLGVCVLYVSSVPRAHAVIQVYQSCTETWNDYTNHLTRDCVSFSFDDGRSPEGGGYLNGGLGIPHGGGAVPNPGNNPTPQRDPKKADKCNSAGDPVVFSTGNEVQAEDDFTSMGAMPLSLTRTYNHYWTGIGLFGRSWISNYDSKLLLTTDSPQSPCYPRPGSTGVCDPTSKPIWAQRPDGRKIKFNYATSPQVGWYEDKPVPVAYIVRSGSGYMLHSEDHTVETYDASGFPLTIDNEQGIGWTYHWNGSHYLEDVTHSSGRKVTFGWTNGRLTSVTDPAGNVYRYSYRSIGVTALAVPASRPLPQLLPPPGDNPPPPSGNPPPLPTGATDAPLLTSATQPATQGGAPATVTTYFYEDSRFATALTGKAINGLRYSWITYDGNAMATQTRLAGNVERYQFAYTMDGNGTITSTTVTNPLGKKTTYDFNAKGNRTGVTGLASEHCPASAKALTYDSNGYLDGATDFNGNVTLYTYAANGQLQQEVRGSGTNAEQVTDYVWDPDHNQPTKITVEGDHATSYNYDANNRLQSVAVKNLSPAVAESQGQTHATSYSYTTWSSGLLKTMVVDGPLAGSADATTLTYAGTGDLLSSKNALGQATTYGNYNGLGLPGSVTTPNGDTHTYVYDARGRHVDDQTHRNGGTQHTYYEYDGFGRLSRVTLPDGQTHSYQYDVAGRLTAEYEPHGDGTFDETVYTYNAMSLPISVTRQHVFVEPRRGTVQ